MSAASAAASGGRASPGWASRLATAPPAALVAELAPAAARSARDRAATASPARRRARRRCRRRRSPRSTSSSSPSAQARSSAVQVPTRTARRTPSSARSASTSAALGPPIPVAWIVSSSPAGGLARVAPEPAGVVAHLRLLEQLLGEQQRPAGVADQDRVGGDRGGRAEREARRLDPSRATRAYRHSRETAGRRSSPTVQRRTVVRRPSVRRIERDEKDRGFIRHEAFEPIRAELLDKGFPSLSIIEAKGSGRQKGDRRALPRLGPDGQRPAEAEAGGRGRGQGQGRSSSRRSSSTPARARSATARSSSCRSRRRFASAPARTGSRSCRRTRRRRSRA